MALDAESHIENSQAHDSQSIEWNSRELSNLRKDLISREDLSAFHQRNNFYWISAVGTDLAIIAASIVLAELYFSAYIYLASIVIIASRQVGIASIALHDGAHRFLSRNAKRNHLIGSMILWFLTVPCIGIDIESYRKGHHLNHHRYLLQEEDPENELFADLYSKFEKNRLRNFVAMCLFTLTGAAYLFTLVKQIFSGSIAIRIVNSLLISSVVLGYVYEVYLIKLVFLYWIVPIATWGIFINTIRAMAEHYPRDAYGSRLQFPTELRTRDVKPSIFDKLFITTRNVNLHLTHHLFPAVPFYNLGKLHKKISETETYQQIAHQTRGYHNFIYEFLFLRTDDQQA